MLIYDKVTRYLDAIPNVAVFSLWKEKCRLIRKWFVEMDINWYSYGVVLLNDSLLTEFYDIYHNSILTKNNPRPIHLLDAFDWKLLNNNIYLWYVRDANNTLIAWWIFIHKPLKQKDTFMLGYRAKTSDIKIQSLNLGYYLEYLFFQHGVSLSVEQYSRGRDDNGYWFIGSAIGVGIHKIQLYFLPYIASLAKELLIDESLISEPSLFFVDPDENKKFTGVRLYIKSTERESPANIQLINLLNKRWYLVHIYLIN